MGRFSGFGVTLAPGRSSSGSPRSTRRRSARSPSASTAVTSSTATRTAWRSASAASSARACARRGASTCAAPTTRPTRRSRPGERYGFVYEINYLRCIHCDLCVEACPTEAITETKLFEFSFANREDAIYTKDELLVDDDGRAQRQPWELWLGGEDDDTSAWMRATAPSGAGRVRGPDRLVGRARVRRTRQPEQGQTEPRQPRPDDLMDTEFVDRSSSWPRSRSSAARSASCSRATRCTPRCSS